jgi:putative lipase involved disintegration of autophagic bodies
MKKILLSLLIIMLITCLIIPVALAGKSKSNNSNKPATQKQEVRQNKSQEKKVTNKERLESRKSARKEKKAAFEKSQLERQELKKATKETLEKQRNIIRRYKIELHKLNQQLKGMSQDERTEYAEEIKSLRQQIKDAQKYRLEIIHTSRKEIRKLYKNTKPCGTPSNEETQNITELLDGLQ